MLYALSTMSMGPHGPSRLRQCALARKGGPGGLAPQAGGLGVPSASPGKQGGLEGGTPPNDGRDLNFFPFYRTLIEPWEEWMIAVLGIDHPLGM